MTSDPSRMQRIKLAPDYEISRVIRGGWQLASGHGQLRSDDPVTDMIAFADAGITTFDCADIYTGVEELIGRFRMRYRDVRGAEALSRIKALVIPPAWEDVWICLDPDGHIQAVGTDAAGRRQYRYHDLWREQRDRVKHDRVLGFGHGSLVRTASLNRSSPGFARKWGSRDVSKIGNR